ncbi:siderophore ABC transporter substrate-binding protein [Paralimibaculum aggregatum]|nr:siderophore ABC transporter substrate-binding protein [Limibaculum sp. NKW23]
MAGAARRRAGGGCAVLGLALAGLLLTPAAGAEVTVATARGPVAVETDPARPVALDIAAIDTLDALGVDLAGVPAQLYLDHLAHLGGRAEPVGTLFEPDYEALAALAPELIIAGGRSAGEVDGLARLAPTIDMTIWGDDLVAQSFARLRDYGRIFGREDAAAELAARLEGAIAAARAAASGRGNALILLVNGPKISAYGPGSRFGWVHTALGIPPAVEGLDTANHGQAVSFEFVHVADPDWLIVIDRSAAIGERGAGVSPTLGNAVIAETAAWRSGRIIELDAAGAYIAAGGVRAMTGMFDTIAAGFLAHR